MKTKHSVENLAPLLTVAIIIVVTAGLRIRLLDIPLERDEGEYAYAGQLFLQGVLPYLHVYNMKMPGIYVAYAAILALFGQTHIAVHLGLLLINAVTILLIFLLTKHLVDSSAGAFAAATFALLSLLSSVLGTSANAEHFVILFALGGLLLLIHALERKKLFLLFIASVLLGIGFLMKQHGIAFIVFAGLYLFFSQFRSKPIKVRPFVLKVVLFSFGAILPFALTCLILWRRGVFEKFWFWTFAYSREYVSARTLEKGLIDLRIRIMDVVGSAVLIWIFAGIGLLTLLCKKKFRDRIPFVLGMLLFSFLSILPGLYFRPHYFILLIPAVALLSGLGFSGIRQTLSGRKNMIVKNLIPITLGIVTLFFTLYQHRNLLLLKNAAEVSRTIFGLNPFIESLKIAEYINANSSSDDTIAVLGSEPQIFFYSKRRSATSYIYMYPLMEPHPFAIDMQNEMIGQIESASPKFIITVNVRTSWLQSPRSKTKIFDWLYEYQKKYYYTAGFVDMVSMDKTVYLWNEKARGYSPASRLWLEILQRRTDI